MKKTNNLDKRDNFHIHRKTNEKEIFKKISNLLKMSDRDWIKKLLKKYLSEFDSNNKKLMKIVGEILNKNENKNKNDKKNIKISIIGFGSAGERHTRILKKNLVLKILLLFKKKIYKPKII